MYDKEQQAFLDKMALPVTDLETGKDMIEQIRAENSATLERMRHMGQQRRPNQIKYQSLLDYSYELKKVKHKVQSQMAIIFKVNRGKTNAQTQTSN